MFNKFSGGRGYISENQDVNHINCLSIVAPTNINDDIKHTCFRKRRLFNCIVFCVKTTPQHGYKMSLRYQSHDIYLTI